MPEWTTPELWPDWCAATSASLSRTTTSRPAWASRRPTARPTRPAPAITTASGPGVMRHRSLGLRRTDVSPRPGPLRARARGAARTARRGGRERQEQDQRRAGDEPARPADPEDHGVVGRRTRVVLLPDARQDEH